MFFYFNNYFYIRRIYPQNSDGFPIYNSSGKYVIKLWINGIWRRVVIDDRFPLGSKQKLRCGHRLIFYYSYRVKSGSILSSNENELWVSILEKSYHKIRGGYDSYGSNPVNLEIKKTNW